MMKTKFSECLFGQELSNCIITIGRFSFILLFAFCLTNNASAQCLTDDSEEPTVVCRNLHTTFMPDTCMVVVWAKDMITSVSDDKTPTDQLIVSFDQAGNEMSKTLFGADGFEQEVYIWVTDRCGKQTACRTNVIINDNDNSCVRRFFDLALIKTVNVTTPGPFLPGSNVTFDIQVINQGNIDAFDIDLTDYVPNGLILNDPNWSIVGGNAVWNSAISSLPGGSRTTRQISFTIDADFKGESIINLAEISGADDDTNPNNADPVDDDSTPDSNPNDPGADPDNGTDDTINNENGDEDDHDPAEIKIEKYDLSIDKSIVSVGPYNLGDLITYRITVNNEGSIAATDIEVTDFPQSDALTFVSSNVNSEPNVIRINDFVYEVRSLSPGTSEAFEISFRISSDYQGESIMNTVEITGDDEEYEDVDSDPDLRKDTNDGKDDVVNGDEDGNNDGPGDLNTFDDDEDMVTIPVVQIFDLALRKTSSPSNPVQIFEGDDVTFNITVFNQGTLTATRIDLVDYIPDGLVLNDSDWTLNGNVATITDIMATPLLPGENTVVPITFTVSTNTAGTLLNYAEILRGDNIMNLPDCDSNPDSSNDDNVIDDRVDSGKSTDFERTRDEDDHDVEPVEVQRYDLAIDKILSTTGPYQLGDEITYNIVVKNEGSINASDVIVTDFPQSNALTFVSNSAGTNNNVTRINDLIYSISSLNANDTETFQITFRINAGFTGDMIMNTVEITGDDEEYEDVDSDPDSRKDSNDGRDDVVNGDEDGNNDGVGDTNTFDDDEDMVTLTVDRYDLAIDKETISTAPYLIGDTVTFEIEIENQGSLNAALVEITDFPQQGLVYVDDNVGTNGNITGTANNYVVLSLPSGATEKFQIRFRIDETFMGAELMNIVEITKDDGDDIDSDPETDKGTDDGKDGSNDGNDDDEDMEVISVDNYDLALMKVVTSTGTFSLGDDVSYGIMVINQGTLPSGSITVTDYLPTGMSFNASLNTGWTLQSGNKLVRTISNIAAGDVDTIDLILSIREDFNGTTIRNWAEISSDSGDDIDSTPDDTNFNQPGESDDLLDDDVKNENGNNGGDEDDHDPAEIKVDRYDLAIMKIADSNGPFRPGENVGYSIMVINQGTLASGPVTVTDYLPSEMTLSPTDNNGWTVGTNGRLTNAINNIPAGSTSTLNLVLTIDPSFRGSSLRNWAEISSDSGDDDDSTPDDTNFNQSGETDDLTDDNVKDEDGTNGGDEDDHDPAEIDVVYYDLAIMKTAITTGALSQGDDVTFAIMVINQGTEDSGPVVLTDYIPSSMSLSSIDNNNWTSVAGGNIINNISNIPAGQTETLNLVLKINDNFPGGRIINWVEISSDSGDDVDSTPDGINFNQPGETDDLNDDDVKSEDGTNGGDEDDHDPAQISVNAYDLALVKTVNGNGPFVRGGDVPFVIQVINQGDVASGSVTVTDYLPAGASLSSNDTNGWAVNGTKLTRTISNIAQGATATLNLILTIDSGFTGTSIRNWAEISSDSGVDIDSTPDDTNFNQSGETDDLTDDDVTNQDGTNGGDEDDHDPAEVMIDFYDLALTKVASGTGPFEPGDDVTFNITLLNQGTLPSGSVTITDYIPNGMSLSSNDTNGWVVGTNNRVSRVVSNVTAGNSETIPLVLTISSTFTGSTLRNWAEISSDSGNDIDSTPDGTNFNQTGETDDLTDDNVTNQNGNNGGDEDDHDPAEIAVVRYDLAIMKTVTSTGSFEPGDDVSYAIMVVNQGTLPSGSVTVTDYVPAGMSLSPTDSNGWASSGSNLTNTISNIPIGQTTTINLVLRIANSYRGSTLRNWVEISADSGNDVDSTPDGTNFNQSGESDDLTDDDVKNENGNNGGDEDDHDPAQIAVDYYDLALTKVASSTGPFLPGEDVTFTITIVNQGTLPSGSVVVTDYLPAELTLSSNDNNGWSQNGTGKLINTLSSIAAGNQQAVQLILTLNSDLSGSGSALRNWAEISSDSGDDIDSTPDDTNFNQSGETDDLADDNVITQDGNNGGDEDDHDPAEISIVTDLCVCPDEAFIGQAVVTCAGGAFSNEAVAAILDLRNANTAPLGDNWADPVTPGATTVGIRKPSTWTIEQLGQVFGTSLGRTNGDIYFGATNVYAYDGDPFTPSGIGPGGEQGLYKANFANPGSVSTLVTTTNSFVSNPVGTSIVPGKALTLNGNNPLPTGWGNIAYDEMSNTLYGTNLSDGRIYAINASSGIILQVYDPFGVATSFLSTPMPAGEALWAIELNECTRQLFFMRQLPSGGGEVLGDDGGVRSKNIYSINIDNAGTIDPASLALALTVNVGTREKIPDIDFNTNCDRMLLAERGTVHNSLTLLYELNNGAWNLVTDITMGSLDGVDEWEMGLNSSGGVAFGSDQAANGQCDTILWSMGDCFDAADVFGECNTYGPQGAYYPASNPTALSGELSASAIYIDVTPEFNIDPRFSKFGLGDIEIYSCCCPSSSSNFSSETAEVAGAIITNDNVSASNFTIDVEGGDVKGYAISNDEGQYQFSSLDMHEDYMIVPSKVDDMVAGVTTLDLLHIQNHILGINEINDPKLLVAADINNSGSIDARDILLLREILLGKFFIEPTTEAWRFITADSDMETLEDEMIYNDHYLINSLEGDEMKNDFYAIKVGDINESLNTAQTRTRDYFEIIIKERDSHFDFVVNRDLITNGFQLALNIDGFEIANLESEIFTIGLNNYNIRDNKLLISVTSKDLINIEEGDVLFTLTSNVNVGNRAVIEKASSMVAEIYFSNNEALPIKLNNGIDPLGYSLGQNIPNPFSSATDIEFEIPFTQNVNLTFYSSDGSVLHSVERTFDQGSNIYELNKEMLKGYSGTIIYKMITQEYSSSKRLILIE